MAPLIGITGRRLKASAVRSVDGRFADTYVDHYPIDFADSIAAAGGAPVYLPFSGTSQAMLGRLDGLVLTGGQDVDPENWGGPTAVTNGADPRLDINTIDPERDDEETKLLRFALAEDLAVLGVCRGMQLINVAVGGTLHPHLGAQGPDSHTQLVAPPHDGPDWHTVRFTPGSRMAEIYGGPVVRNSWHHQAVHTTGQGLVVTGRTADGVAEALESTESSLVAVQWHPEYMTKTDPVFDWLVDRARRRSARPRT